MTEKHRLKKTSPMVITSRLRFHVLLTSSRVIREFLGTVLDPYRARELKAIVDTAIDLNDSVQNLRTAIYTCKRLASGETIPGAEKRPLEFWTKRGLNYLERYLKLMVYALYLHEQKHVLFAQNYSDWLKERWGIQRFIRGMNLE